MPTKYRRGRTMTKSKLALTKKQEEMLHLLRLDGLRREIELFEAEEAFKKAQEIEKAVHQHVIDNNEYISEYESENGTFDRITNGEHDFLMSESTFINDYLPKVKAAFMELYGIDNPLNFVYTSPMRERAFTAKKDYLRIAVDFLKISGAPQAADLEKAVNGYMKPELEKKLMDLNERFISGKPIA
jgi:hypothetical protein